MNNIEYYINEIKKDNWNVISDDLINEILNNNKLYDFTFENNDIKTIIYSIKDKLYYKKINLLNDDFDLLINKSNNFYEKFDNINLKIKKIYNIPFNITDFIDYKNGILYIIKYN